MAGDFHDRMQHLIDQVKPGTIVARDEVNQVYAKYQELREDLKHPGGGQAHYTRDSLLNGTDDMMRTWADHLVTADGSDLVGGTVRNAEHLAAGIYERAPFEFGDLKASPHPQVIDNGAVVYDRPPMIHRLSEDELRAKGHVRALGFGNASNAELHRRLGNG